MYEKNAITKNCPKTGAGDFKEKYMTENNTPMTENEQLKIRNGTLGCGVLRIATSGF